MSCACQRKKSCSCRCGSGCYCHGPKPCPKPEIVSCFSRRPDEMPISDALGPYPDEIILSVLDRILYYAGASKIIHQLTLAMRLRKLASPPTYALGAKDSQTSNMSNCSSCTSLSKFCSARSVGFGHSPKRSSSARSKCSISPPPCSTRPRTPRVDFANPVADERQMAGSSAPHCIKHSLSNASIAYRRLKSKLASSFKCGKKWLWTRLVCSENGFHVYEVYKTGNAPKGSIKKASGKEPLILFLVMPSGHVMPFESLSPSKDISPGSTTLS